MEEGWGVEMERCLFCGGNIIRKQCLQCGRSDDIKYELYVQEMQKKCKDDGSMWNRHPIRKVMGFYDREEKNDGDLNREACTEGKPVLPSIIKRRGQGPYRRRKNV